MSLGSARPRTLGGIFVLSAVVVAAVAGAAGHATARSSLRPLVVQPVAAKSLTAPLLTSGCLAQIGIHCYAPYQFAKAYRLNDLRAAGIDGRGQTIAIVDSFGSPTIVNDLHQFDQTFGVANTAGIPIDPAIAQDPNLTVIHPAGAPPPSTRRTATWSAGRRRRPSTSSGPT